MKLSRLLTAGLILAGLMVYVACRKFDQQNEPNGLSLAEEKFFSKYPPSDPLLTSIRNYFKEKNEQFNFAEKVVERIGYPRWDKTYTVTGAASRIMTEAEGDTVAVTYIPFVREEENFVNASLLVKTTPTDTAFKYVCDWQYASYGFDTTAAGWNANDVFHVFALMDNLVFGRNSFRIVDSNLLVAAERNALQSANLSFNATTVTRTLGSTGTGRGNGGYVNEVLMPVEVCTPISVCLWECPENMRGTGSNTTESLPCCMIAATYEVCTTVMVWISGSGEGGTGTGTGGTTTGGSGGTGYIPPECPGTVTPDNVTNPCGPGWTPTTSSGYDPNAGVGVFNNQIVSSHDLVKIENWRANNLDTLGLDSCRRELLRKLISTIGPSPLGVFLSKLDNAIGVPNTVDKFFIHFSIRPLNNHSGLTEHASYDEISKEFEVDIILDSTTSKNATELFIANTLFHEIIHAYMTFIWKKLNLGATQQEMDSLKYDQVFNAYVDTLRIRDSLNPRLAELQMESIQHNYMADKLLDYMAATIKQFDNNPSTPDRYYWYLAWAGLTRKQVRTWKYHWPNFPTWPPSNPAPVNDSTRGLKYALTLSRIDTIYNKVLDDEEKSLPGAKGRKPVQGGCY